jgi:hypothetical protein
MVETNTGHRATEPQRKRETGEGKVYLTVISPALPLFLCVSVALWPVSGQED